MHFNRLSKIGFHAARIISIKKPLLLAPCLLLMLLACSPSQVAPFNDPTPQATRLLEPAGIPENQISFPTLIPTKTPFPEVTLILSPTPIPDYRNSIVFVSDRDGDKEIYRMDVDGSDFTRLTGTVGSESSPQWSFDKIRILFLSSVGASNHLYTINPDGGQLVELTPGGLSVSLCKWSPTSYLVACAAVKDDSSESDLILVDADDGEIKTAFTLGRTVLDLAWSPDGRQIALAADDIDGITVYDLADDSVRDYELGEGLTQRVAWSNNGNRLAYSFGPRGEGEFATLYTVKTDFVDPKKWIERGGPDWVVSFAPGDEQVLLESSRGGHSEIYVFDFVASSLIQLSNTREGEGISGSANSSPVYSADGGRIVYVSIREGQSDIYVMNADGTRVKNLTAHPGADGEPDW
jgi:Tol biopolymer transport system component